MVNKNSSYLIQSNFGTQDDFEVVFATVENTVQHWSRNNGDPTLPWVPGPTFASEVNPSP
jgi:hypothetical protein